MQLSSVGTISSAFRSKLAASLRLFGMHGGAHLSGERRADHVPGGAQDSGAAAAVCAVAILCSISVLSDAQIGVRHQMRVTAAKGVICSTLRRDLSQCG